MFLGRSAGSTRRVLVVLAFALSTAAFGGCVQKMAQQPSYRPLQESRFFPNGMASQPPVPSTVPRDAELDPAIASGTAGGSPVTSIPIPVTPEVIAQGMKDYGIFCAPCHGTSGAGDGLVVARGFPAPSPLNSDRIRSVAVGTQFQSLTSGVGVMPGLAGQLSARDRWALVAYLQRLEAGTP